MPEGIAEVTVTGGGSPVEGVPVFAFKDDGVYLDLTDTTDASGITSFRLPEQSYQFRADRMGSQYWSDVLALSPGITNPISIDVGGGDLVYTLTRDSGASPMQGVNSYLFTEAGAYMGMYGATDASGEVPYDVSKGSYKVRSDYLGYQFWSSVVDTSASLTLTQDIPHMGVDVGVLSSYQGTYTPITGVKTYLFKSSGAYMGKTLTTDASGLVTYDLPEREYKVRGDYLGYQWWSDPFTWSNADVVIPEGEVTITVTDSGAPAQANVYVFTSGGSYMGLYASTDANGEVSFLLPADGGNSTNYNGYKFRADYSGTQTWSDSLLVTADVNNPISIEVGGSAAVQSLRGAYATRQSRGDEVQVASLFMLPGILAGLTNSAFADSNGEHLYFYHSDHLGTPLFLTDTDGVVVWRGEYLPFGEVFTEDKDPDGDGVEVEQPFRFPGQYEDSETGLYYNYFRDYDPSIGRYVEPDPIGLAGGVNLWGYAGQSPAYWSDSAGLFKFNAELMWGAAAGANVKLFGKDVASAFVDFGTNHSPLFGENYVTQGAGLQGLFAEAYWGRKALGQTCGYKRDALGRIIPGTARSVNDVLSGAKPDWDITPFNKGWFSANMDDITLEAQFIIGFKVVMDISKEWEYVKTNFIEQEGYFIP